MLKLFGHVDAALLQVICSLERSKSYHSDTSKPCRPNQKVEKEKVVVFRPVAPRHLHLTSTLPRSCARASSLVHCPLPNVGVCARSLFRFRGGSRYNLEENDPADSVLFANATNATSDLSNAFALDMTYRVLYYGTRNKVRRVFNQQCETRRTTKKTRGAVNKMGLLEFQRSPHLCRELVLYTVVEVARFGEKSNVLKMMGPP